MEFTKPYLAGFFDGDGCVHISTRKEWDSYSTIMFSVCNLNSDVLQQYQLRWGGKVNPVKRESRKNKRPAYAWNMAGLQAKSFVDDLLPHAIIKQKHLEIANRFLQTYKQINPDMPDRSQRRLDLRAELSAIQVRGKERKTLFEPIGIIKPSIEYIAGLFDAEGCVTAPYIQGDCHRLKVVISSSVLAPLTSIKTMFGGNIYISPPRNERCLPVNHWTLHWLNLQRSKIAEKLTASNSGTWKQREGVTTPPHHPLVQP